MYSRPDLRLWSSLEHNGDVYSCDHFVEPRYRLGNIHETHLLKLVSSPEQRKFGDDKRDSLTPQCQRCEVKALCNGGCPKDRFVLSRDGDPGQNYLCAGLELFLLTRVLRCRQWPNCCSGAGRPLDVMAFVAAEDAKRRRNQPCPCGSGERFRSCHGDNAPHSPFSPLDTPTNRSQDGPVMPMQAETLPQPRAGPVAEATM